MRRLSSNEAQAGIQNRQKSKVELGTVQLRRLICNAVLLESLTRPFARITAAEDGANAIGLQRLRKLGDDGRGRERRLPLEDAINPRGDKSQPSCCPTIRRWVDESKVADARQRRAHHDAAFNRSLDCLNVDIARDVVAELGVILTPGCVGIALASFLDDPFADRRVHDPRRRPPAEAGRRSERQPDNADAVDIYLQAHAILNRPLSVQGFADARKLLDQALAISPDYPMALVDRAWTDVGVGEDIFLPGTIPLDKA